MCLGSIEVLTDVWDEGGVRSGRLEGGRVVSLSFVPDASVGAFLLLHLGIPVEVIEPDTAREALLLRTSTPIETQEAPP
jgi:hydrogenase maturation factor